MNYRLCIALALYAVCVTATSFAQQLFHVVNLDATYQVPSAQQPSTQVRYDATIISTILEAYPIVCAIDLPLPTGNETIVLAQSSLISSNTTIVRGTSNGDEATNYLNRIRCYRGRTATGDVVCATFTAERIYCTIMNPVAVHVLTQRSNDHTYSLVQSLPSPSPFICGTSDTDMDTRLSELLHTPSKRPVLQSTNTLTISIAVEIDNILAARYTDTTQAIAYSLSVLEASSVIMERDLNAKYAITYVRIWQTRPPYVNPSSAPSPNTMSNAIKRFAAWWSSNMKGKIEYDAVHWLSYSNQNAGIASRIGGVCSDSGTYALTFLKQDLTQSNSRSGDVQVLTHEFGHVFGSPHTHSCLWQDGPIDNCAGAENGPCSYTRSSNETGTIMSYCLMRGSTYPFSMSFHPQCASLVRAHLNRVPCVGNQPITRSGRIFGYVRDKSGKPIANIILTIRPMNELYWEGTPQIVGDSAYTTKADGFYEFKNLASGLYKIVLSDNYTVLPNSPGESEQSVIMRTMFMMNDTAVQKNWILGKLNRLLIITGDTTAQAGFTLMTILPLDTLPMQIAGSGSTTVYATNNVLATYLQPGKYLIYPWNSGSTSGTLFTPPYQLITISENQTQSVVRFSQRLGQRNTYLGIAGERPSAISSTLLPLINEPIAFATTAVSSPDSTVRTDSNGVVVTYSPVGSSQRYARFATIDTSKIITENAPWSPWLMTNSAITLLYRRPRRAAFIERYAFAQEQGTFTDIRTSGTPITIADSNPRIPITLPFPFRYGDSTYTTADVWTLGALSVGAVVRSANAASQPTIYYGYPAGGILQLHSQNYIAVSGSDSTRSIQIWTQTSGTAPNRMFTVQWHFIRRIAGTRDSISFVSQLRIREQSGSIEFIYGDCAINQQTQSLSTTGWVGLQGADALDVHSRTSTGSWTSNTRGVRIGATLPTMPFQVGQLPQRGLTLRWVDTTNSINSISTEQAPQGITIMPNPATDVLTVTTTTNQPITIEILDALGKVMYTRRDESSSSYSIPLVGIASGIYYCRTTTSNAVTTQAFSVIR